MKKDNIELEQEFFKTANNAAGISVTSFYECDDGVYVTGLVIIDNSGNYNDRWFCRE